MRLKTGAAVSPNRGTPMILYGRNISPFARRVAVWCALQGRRVDQRQIPVLGPTFAEVLAQNPTGRVPILVLDDGTRLIESMAICDYLDETAPNGGRLVPEGGAARLDCLQRVALGQAVAEKAVALLYEIQRRPAELHWPDWQQRLGLQVAGGVAEMETRCPDTWSGDDRPDGGDVAFVIAWQFIEISNPGVITTPIPRLTALCARAMELPAFAATRPTAL